MKLIPLTQGKFAIVDDEDYERIINSGYVWNAVEQKTKLRTYWRAHGSNGGEDRVLMHRFIMEPPENMEIDHKNCDGLDNRRENLRFATHSQNLGNRRVSKASQSGYKGVRLSRDKFRAYIVRDKKEIYLGVYDDVLDAAIAYNNAAEKIYGDFARLNRV